MRIQAHCVALALVCSGALAAPAGDKAVAYKWIDENGVTHYGDAIPPQYARKESAILNNQGVEIGRKEGAKTAEQLAEEVRLHEAEIRRKQHDTFLLTTYTSVKDIESLRDERLAQISGQRNAARAYIEGLNARLGSLQSRAFGFKPYNDKPSARRMPDDLAEDLMRTLNEIRTQNTALASKDTEEKALRQQFQTDIERFRELRAMRQNR